MKNTPDIRVVAAVIQQNDAYLIARRPAHKRHGDLWEFPGGKMHPGESPLEATKRELSEELNVQVLTVGEPLYTRGDPGSPYIIDFIPTQITGTPRPSEHPEIRWATLTDLRALPLAPTDAHFVTEYLSNT